MGKQRGFTLIELLVVIAIIALLMAILMPALAKVRVQAKDVMALAGKKELATAGFNYANDNEGKFDSGGSCYLEKWANSWKPYYQDDDIRVCPTATKFWFDNPTNSGDMQGTTPDNRTDTPFSAWGKYADQAGEYAPDCSSRRWEHMGLYGSIGSNSWIYDYDASVADENKYWRTINVKGADRIPMVADCLHVGSRPRTTDEFSEYNGHQTGGPFAGGTVNGIQRFQVDRHAGGIQVALLDFSVRRVGVKPVAWWLRWHRGYDGEKTFDERFDRNPENWKWMSSYRYEDY